MTNTPRPRAAQAPLNRKPHTVSEVAVFDGADRVGSIVERGGRHLAYTNGGRLIGSYASRAEAMRAIPTKGLRMRG